MSVPKYVNNFQVFVAKGDNICDGETTISFNIVYREGVFEQHNNPIGNGVVDVVPGDGAITKTENVTSVIMNRAGLYSLRDSLNSVITQMEVDEKMRNLSNKSDNKN